MITSLSVAGNCRKKYVLGSDCYGKLVKVITLDLCGVFVAPQTLAYFKLKYLNQWEV